MKTFHSRRLVAAAGLIAIAFASAAPAKSWGEWTVPARIDTLPNSGANLSTLAADGCATHSSDGLTIIFASDRSGDFDLYMATRSSTSEGFGTAVPLPAPVNSASHESCATIANGGRLYFSSNRHDPAYDLYVSRLGQDGWSEPANLGPNINQPGSLEEVATFYEDEQGTEVMLFCRRTQNGTVGKIYQSVDGGPPTLVAGGPHSSASDCRPSVTRDGLTIFFDSTRSGLPDLYYSTRSSTSQDFGEAELMTDLNSPALELRPYISKDGTFITFSSNRLGSVSPAPDIWYATREKVTGGE